jgi:hypothetical protein
MRSGELIGFAYPDLGGETPHRSAGPAKREALSCESVVESAQISANTRPNPDSRRRAADNVLTRRVIDSIRSRSPGSPDSRRATRLSAHQPRSLLRGC